MRQWRGDLSDQCARAMPRVLYTMAVRLSWLIMRQDSSGIGLRRMRVVDFNRKGWRPLP